MAGTTLLFSLSVLEGLRALGLVIPTAEAERYVQLWRYVALVMGCDRDLVPGSELEASQLAELISATMDPPDDDSRALVAAMLDAPADPARAPPSSSARPA